MRQDRGQRVRIIVENIDGLAAAAVVDQAGTVWVVVSEHAPRPYHAAADVMAEVLGETLPIEVTIEFGPTCTDHQPMGPSELRLVS